MPLGGHMLLSEVLHYGGLDHKANGVLKNKWQIN